MHIMRKISAFRGSRHVILALGFLTSLATIALPATASAAWVSTTTRSPIPQLLANAPITGALPGSTSMNVLVGLKLQNQSAMSAFEKNLFTPGNPGYGKTLTTSQFTSMFSPTAVQSQLVVSYLTAAGFTNIEVAPNRMYVTATGTASIVQAAFNTTLAQLTFNGSTIFANTSDAQVPDSLSDIVLSVIGLNSLPGMHTFLKKHVTPAAAGTPSPLMEYTPAAFQTVYDVGSSPTASDTTIAIFAEGDLTQVVKDLRMEEDANKLPEVPYTVVPTGLASPDTSGADEFDLDTQTSTGLADQVNMLLIYDATSLNDIDLIPGFNKFVVDNAAVAGSASFGECEVQEMLAGGIPTYDQIFHEASLQGQTVFASAGDDGAACGVFVATGVPDTGLVTGQNYPCTSPYVMCAGGTTLVTDADNNYIYEIAWDSTGGGTSEVEPPEFWQYGIVPTSSATVPEVGTIPLYKGVPDVAMDADNELSPALIYVNGATEGVGGTSLSSPLALGAWARIQSAHCNSLGVAGPVLYPFATGISASSPAVPAVANFHDITLGTNGIYTALPGWDYVTGLGTFDISVVNAALAAVPCTYTPGSTTGSTTVTTGGSSSPSQGGGGGGSFGIDVISGLLIGAAWRRRRIQAV